MKLHFLRQKNERKKLISSKSISIFSIVISIFRDETLMRFKIHQKADCFRRLHFELRTEYYVQWNPFFSIFLENRIRARTRTRWNLMKILLSFYMALVWCCFNFKQWNKEKSLQYTNRFNFYVFGTRKCNFNRSRINVFFLIRKTFYGIFTALRTKIVNDMLLLFWFDAVNSVTFRFTIHYDGLKLYFLWAISWAWWISNEIKM